MSRTFTKNSSNLMLLGVGVAQSLLSVARRISVHAWANYATATSGATDNTIVHFKGNSTASFLFFGLDGSGSRPVFRLGGRSISTDSFQSAASSSSLWAGGWFCGGGVIDYAGTIDVYKDGSHETRATASFGSASWSAGTPSSNDSIGGNGDSSNTNAMLNGQIAEVAIWAEAISPLAFAELAAGVHPFYLRNAPPPLIYFPLTGADSPERDFASGLTGTITGSVPAGEHPWIGYGAANSGAFASAGPLIRRIICGRAA